MLTKAPSFWWKQGSLSGALLAPVSWLYGAVSGARMRPVAKNKIDIPVICIGNFTAGGAGKTPLAESLARYARERGFNPGFVLRGFGGAVQRATLVDYSRHTFYDVGDEALMLSETAPTAVSPARADAAELLKENGVDLIIMDDGLQSGKLFWDFSIAAIDTQRGLGNGRCIPAGPLRAPLPIQLEKTDLVVLNGNEDQDGALVSFMSGQGAQLACVRTVTNEEGPLFTGVRVVAYAGIGHPEKFFSTLRQIGAEVVQMRPLADHQVFSSALARSLLLEAKEHRAQLVTTSKDYARLAGAVDPDLVALRQKSRVLSVMTIFDDQRALESILDTAIENFKNRRNS